MQHTITPSGEPLASAPVPDDLVRRYGRVMRMSESPGTWHRQAKYPGPFPAATRSLTSRDIAGVLAQRHHIAARAPEDGMTDRFAFDLDCASESDVTRRDSHYWIIRRIMGEHRMPLVYQTPSGFGLRVVYRVPEMPLERLITGRGTGLVAEVLRAAGLPIRSGEIELFPQRTQADRLPLGRNMPLLDPNTLKPIPGAAIGDGFDLGPLRGAVIVLEEWHARVYDDLVAHLESMPGQPQVRVALVERAKGDEHFVRVANGVRPSVKTLELVHHGLTAPSFRFVSEWPVGVAILLAPELFRLTEAAVTDDVTVARALAEWLAGHHNGYSQEWAASVRRYGTAASAMEAWVRRYLRRSQFTGEHLVDRLRRAAGMLDGSLRRTFLISDEERLEMVLLAEAAGLRGSALYRAEAWLAAFRRSVKRIVAYHVRRGKPLEERGRPGERKVMVPIAARWMQKWPYGKGRRGGEATYVTYRRLLFDTGWMQIERESPIAAAYRRGVRPPGDMVFDPNLYAVPVPNMELRVRDIGVDAKRLQSVLDWLRPEMSGRVIGINEAHHILWLVRTERPVRRRYGHRLGTRIMQLADVLEAELHSTAATAG